MKKIQQIRLTLLNKCKARAIRNHNNKRYLQAVKRIAEIEVMDELNQALKQN